MEVSDNQDLDNGRSTVRLKRLNIIHGMPRLLSICDSKSDLVLNADELNFILFVKNREAIEVVSNIQLYLCLSHNRSFCK